MRLQVTPGMARCGDYMADIIDVNPDNSPVSVDLPEVFYME